MDTIVSSQPTVMPLNPLIGHSGISNFLFFTYCFAFLVLSIITAPHNFTAQNLHPHPVHQKFFHFPTLSHPIPVPFRFWLLLVYILYLPFPPIIFVHLTKHTPLFVSQPFPNLFTFSTKNFLYLITQSAYLLLILLTVDLPYHKIPHSDNFKMELRTTDALSDTFSRVRQRRPILRWPHQIGEKARSLHLRGKAPIRKLVLIITAGLILACSRFFQGPSSPLNSGLEPLQV